MHRTGARIKYTRAIARSMRAYRVCDMLGLFGLIRVSGATAE